jgi:hypothetical protein
MDTFAEDCCLGAANLLLLSGRRAFACRLG